MVMQDFLKGTEKVKRIMKGGISEFRKFPNGIIRSGMILSYPYDCRNAFEC